MSGPVTGDPVDHPTVCELLLPVCKTPFSNFLFSIISINYKDTKSLQRENLSEFVIGNKIYPNSSIEIHAVFSLMIAISIFPTLG